MKERLDQLLVEQGFFETRERAKRAIIEGIVAVEGYQHLKPGTRIDENAKITIKDKKRIFPYVSRGGLKLKKALEEFQIIVKDKVALDIGASTGGFTDCLLQFGAMKVYAVDVGYGQFDWKLRNDSRVVLRERVNARYLTREVVPEDVDIVVMDVSFISVSKIIPSVLSFLKDEGDIIILVKPQFEAGKEDVGKGVIRDSKIHKKVIKSVLDRCAEFSLGFLGLTWSPIKGPKGNMEFLLWCKKGIKCTLNIEEYINRVVEEAHRKLD